MISNISRANFIKDFFNGFLFREKNYKLKSI